MGRTVRIETWVDVDVELKDIDTDVLVEELQARGRAVEGDNYELLIRIYELRRNGRPYESELDTFIYETLGRVL